MKADLGSFFITSFHGIPPNPHDLLMFHLPTVPRSTRAVVLARPSAPRAPTATARPPGPVASASMHHLLGGVGPAAWPLVLGLGAVLRLRDFDLARLDRHQTHQIVRGRQHRLGHVQLVALLDQHTLHWRRLLHHLAHERQDDEEQRHDRQRQHHEPDQPLDTHGTTSFV